MFVTFMPIYTRSHGMDAGHVGLIFAAQALANSLSRIPFGRLSDSVADRSVLVIAGLAAFAATLAAFAFCSSIVPLMICASVLGVSMGIAFTAIGALIAEVVPLELRGLAMGSYNTSIYIGMMLSSAVTGVVAREAGFRSGFFLNGGVGLAVTLLFALIYRKPAASPHERS
jgi:MFS family permease